MISYSRKSLWRLTFAIRGTVLARLWPRILLYTSLTAMVAGLYHLKQVPLEIGPLAHSLVGIALGMLLVFRTNASYDRFWEGRKQWGGIVNASRNLVRAASVHGGDAAALWPLVAAYPVALRDHLRFQRDPDALSRWLDEPRRAHLAEAANPPVAITRWMSQWIAERRAAGALDAPMADRLEGWVGALLDHQGACERILKTPIPFAYVVQIRQLLMIYLVTLPFVLVAALTWWAVPAVAFVSFALLGIEEAGVEIEDPFGTDPNDLPLDDLCAVIARDVETLAG